MLYYDKDVFKIGAYLQTIDFFKDKPKKLVAYWWSLVTLAIFIQIYLLYRVA